MESLHAVLKPKLWGYDRAVDGFLQFQYRSFASDAAHVGIEAARKMSKHRKFGRKACMEKSGRKVDGLHGPAEFQT